MILEATALDVTHWGRPSTHEPLHDFPDPEGSSDHRAGAGGLMRPVHPLDIPVHGCMYLSSNGGFSDIVLFHLESHREVYWGTVGPMPASLPCSAPESL